MDDSRISRLSGKLVVMARQLARVERIGKVEGRIQLPISRSCSELVVAPRLPRKRNAALFMCMSTRRRRWKKQKNQEKGDRNPDRTGTRVIGLAEDVSNSTPRVITVILVHNSSSRCKL